MLCLFQCKIFAKVKYFTENIFILLCLVCIPENAKNCIFKKKNLTISQNNFEQVQVHPKTFLELISGFFFFLGISTTNGYIGLKFEQARV